MAQGVGLGREVSSHKTVEMAVEAVRDNSLQFELKALFTLNPAGLGMHFPNPSFLSSSLFLSACTSASVAGVPTLPVWICVSVNTGEAGAATNLATNA